MYFHSSTRYYLPLLFICHFFHIEQFVAAENSKMSIKTAMKKIPSSSLHVSRPTDWLTSRFHFSFAEYYNPSNTNFGVLRVLNDDLVTARNGFPMHPHRDQEIFSYIVEGKLSHEDSEGHAETLGRGCVQYMSAGRGVYHSEMNQHPSQTVRFLQIWISPDRKGLPVKYGSHRFEEAQRKNTLLQIISGTRSQETAPIVLSQDCNVYVSQLDQGVTVSLDILAGRQAYMVEIEGDLSVNNDTVALSARDAMEIVGPVSLSFTSKSQLAHFIVIEMVGA